MFRERLDRSLPNLSFVGYSGCSGEVKLIDTLLGSNNDVLSGKGQCFGAAIDS